MTEEFKTRAPKARGSKRGQSLEAVKMALETVRANKLRSGLTILGIMIGVCVVIVISSTINGLNRQISTAVEQLGTNVLWVFRFPVIGVRPTSEMLTRKQLTHEDAEAMRDLPHVVAAAGSLRYWNPQFNVGNLSVKYKGRSAQSTILEGDDPETPKIYDLTLDEGRYFTQMDDDRRANVVVLGRDPADQLFGNESAVGKEVEIEGDVFTVVGVMTKRKSIIGGGKNPDDNTAYFPLSTFKKIHPEQKDYWISVKADSANTRGLVTDEITELMRRRRKLHPEQDDNFYIFSPDSITKFLNELTSGLFLFMLAVSSVGLMVGGVGVMNIMLVSVTERTREIGIRKAIGATKRTILLQFTIEAITLCALGGLIGIGLGGLITLIVRAAISFLPATMSTMWTMIAFGVSCGIGLVFGIYPAWKAATLDPIEALRYE
jgi:putative ABC transport system permease protein